MPNCIPQIYVLYSHLNISKKLFSKPFHYWIKHIHVAKDLAFPLESFVLF